MKLSKVGIGDTSYAQFRSIFLSWNASRTFHTNSTRLISLDGCHLHDPFLSTLYLIVGHDACNQNVILAAAVAGNESTETWEGFLAFFKARFSTPSVVVSDRDKGLNRALKKHYPTVPSTMCSLHLARNCGALKTVPKDSSLQLSSVNMVDRLCKVLFSFLLHFILT